MEWFIIIAGWMLLAAAFWWASYGAMVHTVRWCVRSLEKIEKQSQIDFEISRAALRALTDVHEATHQGLDNEYISNLCKYHLCIVASKFEGSAQEIAEELGIPVHLIDKAILNEMERHPDD